MKDNPADLMSTTLSQSFKHGSALRKLLLLPVFIAMTITVCGCTQKTSQRYTLSDAQKKFLKICREESKLPVQLFEADNTIWIYLPMEEDLIDYHGKNRNDEPKSKKEFVINTFEGDHKETKYRFLLDITDGVKTSKDPGYKSDATEAFIKNRLTIYGALEAFLEINELPGDRQFADKARDEKRQDMLESYIPKSKAPEFFVIVISNTKKGLAYKSVFNLNDYKLYRSEVLPFEEYNLREISELYGDQNLINDKEGKNLEIKPVTWSWFFIEQIKNRVNFKFLRSDFPPDKDIIIEIASIIADTFHYYDYADYSGVLIKDLREKTSYNFDRPQLMTFEETASKTKPPPLKMQYIAGPSQTAH